MSPEEKPKVWITATLSNGMTVTVPKEGHERILREMEERLRQRKAGNAPRERKK